MKIKTTESLGPIVTHPNGDIFITGEIRREVVMNIKKISPEIKSFVAAQISISERADQAIKNAIGVSFTPLKQLVGFAAYDGNGYSKDEQSIKKDHYTDAVDSAMRHQWKELSNELPKMMINRIKNDSF